MAASSVPLHYLRVRLPLVWLPSSQHLQTLLAPPVVLWRAPSESGLGPLQGSGRWLVGPAVIQAQILMSRFLPWRMP